MRIPPEWKQAIEQNRLLLLSPFEKKYRRMTTALAEQRNAFVAAMADEVLFIHAPSDSKTESLAHGLLDKEISVLTLDSPCNSTLLSSGAKGLDLNIRDSQ